jgi:endonuclease/exonuclease/phosphatase (EEP) superfamily protein YafD
MPRLPRHKGLLPPLQNVTTVADSAPDAQRPRAQRPWRRRLVTCLLYAAIVPAAVISVLGFFGHFHWILDLFAHFRPQYTAWFAVWTIIAIIARRRDLSVLAFSVTVLNLVPFSHYHPLPLPPTRSSNHDLRVITFNVLGDNTEGTKVLAWLEAQEADVVIITEYNPQWIASLRPLEKQLPHTYLQAGYANFGLAIYSKHPLTEKKRETFCSARTPCLTAKIIVRGVPLKIFAVHPLSPVTKNEFALRNEYLHNLANEVAKSSAPVLVAGDFNVSAFSSYFANFSKRTKLADAAQGRGFHPTYDQYNPLFGIAIDHILHSPEITCVNFQVGPHLGSDHNPILADFTVSPTQSRSFPREEER